MISAPALNLTKEIFEMSHINRMRQDGQTNETKASNICSLNNYPGHSGSGTRRKVYCSCAPRCSTHNSHHIDHKNISIWQSSHTETKLRFTVCFIPFLNVRTDPSSVVLSCFFSCYTGIIYFF